MMDMTQKHKVDIQDYMNMKLRSKKEKPNAKQTEWSTKIDVYRPAFYQTLKRKLDLKCRGSFYHDINN